jgi:hypothetical protein
MPTITIKDEDGKELLSTDLPGHGLGRYFQAAASLRSLVSIAQAFSKPLADRQGTRTLGLTLDEDLPVGAAGELSISGGANAGIGVHESGDTILTGSDLMAPVTVPNGTSYTSLTLEAQLTAGVAGAARALGFGFQAGTAIRYAYFHPFDIVATSPAVRDAMMTMIAAAVFPAEVDDVMRLPVGAYASVAGDGEISFTAKTTLSSATNLLATPGLPIVGSLEVTQGASVSVDAAWTASGDFELRVSRLDPAHVRLSYHRRRGRSLTVSATAKAGVSATFRGRELLATLMTAISRNPEADLVALVNAGLGDEPIEAIQQAVAASIDRSLTLAAQLQVSSLNENEALFCYDVDLTAIGNGEKVAIRDALHGRLSAIDALAASDGTPIRLVASATRKLKERKTTWRINLFGILNVARFGDLVREGTVTFDPVSGSLVALDKVSAQRIGVATRPLRSEDAEKLHRLLLESLMVTAAYHASGVLGASTVSLTAEQSYVEQHGRTNEQDLADHYTALIALGLCDAAERDARVGAATEFGSSIFSVQNRFDAAACNTMFLNASGQARPVSDYEAIARHALLSLLPAGDSARAFRRVALEPDAMWNRIRELGGAIDSSLPDSIRRDTLKLAIVRGDVFTIVWWATAMRKAAIELVAMRTFLGGRDAATLFSNSDFAKARERLSRALGGVVTTSEARFDDPWHVLAMDAAAARKGRLEAAIVTTRFAVRYTDEAAQAVAPAEPVSRASRAPQPRSSGKTMREWTSTERELFNRHVVNLRGGKLSGGGSFSSSVDQVERIFREHIPEYARQQQAAGRPGRVLFFAHGGLTGEREGLLPILARRRFWELNGVYPVYFVWETGLLETVTDLIGIGGARRRDRAAVTDAAIEAAARPGGRVVWGRMKTSAEDSAATDGGSTLVARCAGELWKQTQGAIEFHALGHSAGSIFHAFFLPLLVQQKQLGVPPVDVRTVHLLAPAITTDLFKTRLMNLTGSGQPITRLTVYTMNDQHEQDDASLKPYGKSLLYLVSQAFEEEAATPVLGLQRSLKNDLKLIRFFGLAGTEKAADIAFSTTSDATPLSARTVSITHGGFDNDVATMTSVIRRVLDVPDSTAVVDYFEDAVPGFDRPAVGVRPPEASIAGV